MRLVLATRRLPFFAALSFAPRFLALPFAAVDFLTVAFFTEAFFAEAFFAEAFFPCLLRSGLLDRTLARAGRRRIRTDCFDAAFEGRLCRVGLNPGTVLA